MPSVSRVRKGAMSTVTPPPGSADTMSSIAMMLVGKLVRPPAATPASPVARN
jgi:hypothetical protein